MARPVNRKRADGALVTGEEIVGTLRCASPDCNEVVVRIHLCGSGLVRACCPGCGRWCEYESGTRGWTAALLPKGGVRLVDAPTNAAAGTAGGS